MKEYYTIQDICLCTGLTSRTIRNYMKKGLLTGDKKDRIWQFTSEQVENFTSCPEVKSSIQVRKNALITDFLLERKKKTDQICIILDLAERDHQKTTDFFCRRMEILSPTEKIQFSFEGQNRYSRVLVKGPAAEVLTLVNEFFSEERNAGTEEQE